MRNEIVEEFQDYLKISPIRNSQLINVSFESSDSNLAVLVPNTLVELYIQKDLESRLQITDKATGSLNQQLKELKVKLEQSEKKLQEFRDKESLMMFEVLIV